jgi:hypothetical protein
MWCHKRIAVAAQDSHVCLVRKKAGNERAFADARFAANKYRLPCALRRVLATTRKVIEKGLAFEQAHSCEFADTTGACLVAVTCVECKATEG